MGRSAATRLALASGVIAGLLTAWPRYRLTLAWLAVRGCLPWRLSGFLADAHRRGLLRQAGAVYQVRHARLQDRLARREDSAPSSSSGALLKAYPPRWSC